jgi:hypothetical protein
VLKDSSALTCPAGQTTRAVPQRNRCDTSWKYHFSKKQCAGCALREPGLTNPQSPQGRTVTKNDYEADYAAAQAKAQTPEYAAVRRQHSAIERKLSELIRRHDARHARYRGQPKVLYQCLMTALVVNMKRIARLLLGPPEPTAQKVRAALVAAG